MKVQQKASLKQLDGGMVDYTKKKTSKNKTKKTKIYGKKKKLTENDGKRKKRRISKRGGALGTIADPTIGRCSPSCKIVLV